MKTTRISHAPEAVVQRQLEAYNARDIDALLAVYADDAQAFEHPSTLLASGSAQLRDRFMARLTVGYPDHDAVRAYREGDNHIVVDHEKVTRTFPEGPGSLELLMIYDVQKGRIAKAWSIVGTKKLDAR